MTRTFVFAFLLTITVAAVSVAGTIEGKISGASGQSVVYVDTVSGKAFPVPSEHKVIDQRRLSFDPHIVVIQAGTTVDFQNDDSVQHNVFWPSVGGNKKEGHNMGTWPKGDKRSFKFDQAGVVPLLCNVHPEMSGYVVVSPTPYFAETDASGNFKIENVPDGKYTLVAWHAGMKQQSKPVDVSGAGKVDFALAN
jgi:plastocyanin